MADFILTAKQITYLAHGACRQETADCSLPVLLRIRSLVGRQPAAPSF